MTALERVRRTQRSLEIVIGSSVVLWGGAALFALLIIGTAINAITPLPRIFHTLIPILAVIVGLATLGVMAWRNRFAWSLDRVALWIEERAPELRYALVTAIDPRYQESAGPLMEPAIARVDTGPFVRTAAKQSTLPAAIAFLVAAAVFFAMPAAWKQKLGVDNGGLFGGRSTPAIVGNRLKPLTGTITPPSYANMRTESLRDPSTITGLVGSRVVITGEGSPDGIVVTLQEIPPTVDTIPDSLKKRPVAKEPEDKLATNDSAANVEALKVDSALKAPKKRGPVVPIFQQLKVVAGGRGWMTSFMLADSNPALLKLVDRQYHTTVVVNPLIDQPPTARLLSPLKDTTYKVISGVLHMSADLNDDVGLDTAEFEMVISRAGGGEDFAFATELFSRTKFGGAKGGHLDFSIPYSDVRFRDSSGKATPLEGGDQLSIRAIVWDNNSLTGPGKGVSDTRTIRIALKSEYDSLNVNPAPPSADTAIQTLRMLIMAVERLDTLGYLHHTMDHKVYEDSAIKLGGVADQIKQKIDRIIDEQTGGGEIAENPLLTLARDSMTSAVTELYIADTHGSLPPLYAAYKALQKYSNTNRYYLRGILKADLVNVDRVRLTGKDTAIATGRTPRPMSNVDKADFSHAYALAVQQMRSSPDSAVDAFNLLRVRSLRPYPDLAKALGDAVTAIQAKKDATVPLLQARRILEGSAGALDSLPVWSGAW